MIVQLVSTCSLFVCVSLQELIRFVKTFDDLSNFLCFFRKESAVIAVHFEY